jgi:hypothetical protein
MTEAQVTLESTTGLSLSQQGARGVLVGVGGGAGVGCGADSATFGIGGATHQNYSNFPEERHSDRRQTRNISFVFSSPFPEASVEVVGRWLIARHYLAASKAKLVRLRSPLNTKK